VCTRSRIVDREEIAIDDEATPAAPVTAADDRVRVLVVDDSAEARAAIGNVVVHTPGFELVGSVASGEETLELLSSLDPELVLLDVRMPGLNGPETSRLIRASGARSVVVLVSALSRPELPDSVDECEAAAILHKCELSPRRLVTLWQDLHSQHVRPKAAAAGS
jgi:DNA-binding NarL/FixJ family response regulator